MASVFPFNQTSKLPGLLIDQLKPVILKQVKQFESISNKLTQRLASLKKGVKCNSAEIQDLKNKLNQLKIIIDNLNKILQRLQPLANRLQTITTTVNTIATILLAIPAIIGVPEGPKNQTLQTIADLIAGITAVVNILNIILNIISQLTNKADSLIKLVEKKLASVCPSENQNNQNNDPNAAAGSDSGLSATALNINNEYPSEFYQLINVSEDDIQRRVDEIINLVENQLNVSDNLNEAPSKVLLNTGAPANTLGKLGDYYIDTNTQTIYGPKPSQNSWT